MTAQLSLLPGDKPARARRCDPVSSHQAADEAERSGLIASQAEQTLAAVRAHPGRTSREIAERSGLDRHMVARRLPELEVTGKVWSDPRPSGKRWWARACS